jgi:hypothetical protein
MNKNRIAVLSVIYPIENEVAFDFFESLKNQSYLNFDIIIVNDGYLDFKKITKIYSTLNIIEVKSGGSIVQNRRLMIEEGLRMQYEKFIFLDIDDYAHPSRIECVIKELKSFDIVVNDFMIFSENQDTISNYFSKRIANRQVITVKDIIHKNLIGLSNTACSAKIFSNLEIIWDENIIAVDWYIFSYALISGWKAIFIAKPLTYYRQHKKNTVGLMHSRNIGYNSKVKILHYKAMNNLNIEFQKYYDETKYILDEKIEYPWWWE